MWTRSLQFCLPLGDYNSDAGRLVRGPMTLAATVSPQQRRWDFATVSGEAHCGRGRRRHERLLADFANDGNRTFMPRGSRLRRHGVLEPIAFSRSGTGNIRALYTATHRQGQHPVPKSGQRPISNVAHARRVEMGGWSWSTDGWDFDPRWLPDLYMANATSPATTVASASSFFWARWFKIARSMLPVRRAIDGDGTRLTS